MKDTLNTPYRIGDIVYWISHTVGLEKAKSGTIVAIVPAHTLIRVALADYQHLSDRQLYNHSSLGPHGYCRSMTSYVVAVTTLSPTGKLRKRQTLYWPNVNLLHLWSRDGT